jgi:hypothetical protein
VTLSIFLPHLYSPFIILRVFFMHGTAWHGRACLILAQHNLRKRTVRLRLENLFIFVTVTWKGIQGLLFYVIVLEREWRKGVFEFSLLYLPRFSAFDLGNRRVHEAENRKLYDLCDRAIVCSCIGSLSKYLATSSGRRSDSRNYYPVNCWLTRDGYFEVEKRRWKDTKSHDVSLAYRIIHINQSEIRHIQTMHHPCRE